MHVMISSFLSTVLTKSMCIMMLARTFEFIHVHVCQGIFLYFGCIATPSVPVYIIHVHVHEYHVRIIYMYIVYVYLNFLSVSPETAARRRAHHVNKGEILNVLHSIEIRTLYCVVPPYNKGYTYMYSVFTAHWVTSIFTSRPL